MRRWARSSCVGLVPRLARTKDQFRVLFIIH
jgi:hypothetical protein